MIRGLKQKLFYIIEIGIIFSVLLILAYSVHSINLSKTINEQTYQYNLRISMKFVEDTMENVENMLVTDTEKDETLKKIIKSTSSLKKRIALIEKKSEFRTEIRKNKFLDGLFLYDSGEQIYVGETGKYVTTQTHTIIKENINTIIDCFELGKIKNDWKAVKIQNEYFFFRMMKTGTVYVCAWMQPEHLLEGLTKIDNSDLKYVLCDKKGMLLTSMKGSQGDRKLKTDVNIDSVNCDYYKCDSHTRDVSMIVLINQNTFFKKNFMIALAVCMTLGFGTAFLFIIWWLIKIQFFKPLDTIILQETLEKNKAKLQFLQSQLNPHFLNNCLSLIRNLIIFEEYEEAEETVLVLSDYTRNSLQPDIMISIDREIEMIKSWYILQKKRLKNKLELTIKVDEKIKKELIPTMLIQTFVENSVKHCGDREASVDISVCLNSVKYNDENYLEILVEDQGNGFPEEILKQLREGNVITDQNGKKHIGISGLMQRLKILYEGKAIVELGNRDEGGARIRILIPLYGEKVNN